MSGILKNISNIHNLHASAPTGFGIVTYSKRARFGPRKQQHFQLVVIHRGNLELTVDGRDAGILAGEGILLRPGCDEFFQFSSDQETTHSWCQIAPGMLPPSLAFSPQVTNRPAPCSPWLLRFMRNGWKLGSGPESGEKQKMLTSAVLMAMWDFCRAFSDAREPPMPDSLAKARQLMERKLAEPLFLDELSRHSGVSKGHLILLANRHWGMAPIEYFWRLRLEESARLLRETGLGIGEVAYRTGFANPFHFSRKFKERYGRPPRAWRSAEWTSGVAISSPAPISL